MFVAMSKITPEQVQQFGFVGAFCGGFAVAFARGVLDQPVARAPRRERQHRGAGCRLQQCRLHGHSDVPAGVRPGKRAGLDHRHPVHRLRAVPVRHRHHRNRPAEGRQLLVDRRQGRAGDLHQSALRRTGRGPCRRTDRAEAAGAASSNFTSLLGGAASPAALVCIGLFLAQERVVTARRALDCACWLR